MYVNKVNEKEESQLSSATSASGLFSVATLVDDSSTTTKRLTGMSVC